jgi:hypothetical protein
MLKPVQQQMTVPAAINPFQRGWSTDSTVMTALKGGKRVKSSTDSIQLRGVVN